MGKKKPRAASRYYDASRRLAASYVFIAPLLAVYEGGVFLDPRARNGADPLVRQLFSQLSHLGSAFFSMLILGLLFVAIGRTRQKRIHTPGLYWFMLLESCGWAAAMSAVAFFFPPKSLSLSPLALDLVKSVGAGVYEEIVFRFLLMGGMLLVLQHGLGGHPLWVAPVAVLSSAALFSWAHHAIGGEEFSEKVFLFRTMMGVILGALYYTRGLGIVVYAHALYNVAIVVRHG